MGSGPATVDVALGRPDAPQGVTATANGDNRIDVAWTGVAGATEYRVYRSLTAGGPYDLAGTVSSPQTSFGDTPVSGSVTWHYVVRAFAACESPDSPEATASAGGPCTLGPAFAGLASVSDTESATCALTLAWPSASGRCGGPITYAVHRSPTAPFTPSAANLVASGLAGTTFQDHAALASGATYHYVVRARSNYKIDQSVVVKPGIADPDYGYDLSGWQGRVIENHHVDEQKKPLVTITWDSLTLKQMPDEMIQRCEEDGLDWSSMGLYASEVAPASPRDKNHQVERVKAELEQKHQHGSLRRRGKAVFNKF